LSVERIADGRKNERGAVIALRSSWRKRNMPPKQIVVYSAPGCVVCNKVKEFLVQQGVPFTVKDIVEDEQALNELAEMGVMSTPVTLIDGEVLLGFDRRKIEKLLAG
jgi:glutaredoxin